MSSRKIAKQNDVEDSKSNIYYYIKKYDLESNQKYQKPSYNSHFFDKINTPAKAYILGFILGDGHLTKKQSFEITVAIQDKQVVDFISDKIGGNIQVDKTLDRSKKRFPRARLRIYDKRLYTNFKRYCGGRLKQNRHFPNVSPKLEKYLVLGFFDAEGCVTFGYRKDRNRLWQKISFTSKFKMLEGVQKILLKQNIASKIKPKSGSKCYVLQFSDKNRVLTFLDYIYPKNDNFIVLQRKFGKAQQLRLELG